MLGVALVFAVAVWCASFAAPGHALAAVTGCSQNGGAMTMTGCGQVLCGLEPPASLLAQGALTSVRVHASFKAALRLAVGEVSIAPSAGAVALGWKEFADTFSVRRGKVSTYLFNSVLHL